MNEQFIDKYSMDAIGMDIEAPAENERQANLMRMALGYKRGDVSLNDVPAGVRKAVQRMANDMSEDTLKEFTKVK